ncbi:hypothetical protein OUY22_00755 [Nonomuraea sp. MCN248]|uniref:Uncharacterized protein n=1 Tax=Nonomuraea corallina TaxID=2989783 RepID=A0ABT4S404_9ACTN|nr:hypothetical protein [Nonomuraea corallina]MDA0631929.1 hypothetical protein [Nonomuraea corallina]
MHIDQGELRDLLDERSRPALHRPIPWHSLRARTRGARRRRLSAVTVAVTAAVAVVAAGTVVSLRGPEQVDQPITAKVTEKLPIQYEESDGTVYRRLATATFDPSREQSKTFQVKVSGKPVAILPDCPSPKAAPPHVTARVPGLNKNFTLSPVPFLMNSCERGKAVDMQPFPAGTRTVRVTVKPFPGGTPPGKWRFGVYEWTPPATMRTASPPVEPPAKMGKNFSLVAKGSTTWPSTREVTLTVPNRGRGLAIVTYCGDGLAERLSQKLWVNGRLVKSSTDCSAGAGYLDMGKRPRSEKTTTIRVRLETSIPEYLRRPGTLTVAVYDGDL